MYHDIKCDTVDGGCVVTAFPYDTFESFASTATHENIKHMKSELHRHTSLWKLFFNVRFIVRSHFVFI